MAGPSGVVSISALLGVNGQENSYVGKKSLSQNVFDNFLKTQHLSTPLNSESYRGIANSVGCGYIYPSARSQKLVISGHGRVGCNPWY